MAHSSEYYTTRIAEFKADSEMKAQSLFNRACRGDITYTEAWYSLPGPTPTVQHQNLGGMSSFPQINYIVQYPFLSSTDAAILKTGTEREFREAMDTRSAAQQVIPTNHAQKSQELKKAVDSSREAFDLVTTSIVHRKSRVEELRAKLAAYEADYEKGLREIERSKQEKDTAEYAYLDYTSKASAIMQLAQAESDVIINRLAKHRDSNVARQQEETNVWMQLWKDKEGAVFDDRARVAQARIAVVRVDALTARIEAEARRRLTVDAEFEAAVAARLQEIQVK